MLSERDQAGANPTRAKLATCQTSGKTVVRGRKHNGAGVAPARKTELGSISASPPHLSGIVFFGFSFRFTGFCLGVGGVRRARRKASSRRFSILLSLWSGDFMGTLPAEPTNPDARRFWVDGATEPEKNQLFDLLQLLNRAKNEVSKFRSCIALADIGFDKKRWSRPMRQLGGLAKVDRGCFYAANCSFISAVA
jgi:hypothetical protein